MYQYTRLHFIILLGMLAAVTIGSQPAVEQEGVEGMEHTLGLSWRSPVSALLVNC